jgi:amino acid adenylation domain-containing protein
MAGERASGSERGGRTASLGRLVLDAARAHADRVAFDAGHGAVRYAELVLQAGRIARALAQVTPGSPALGAVFASRGELAYTGILGTLFAGAGYVPLNPKFPDQRSGWMLAQSGAATLVTEVALLDRARELLQASSATRVVVVPDLDDASELRRQWPGLRIVDRAELAKLEPRFDAVDVPAEDIAYVMFTSGSTGTPKGVMVTHRNVTHHLAAVWERYGIGPDDRLSQTFDLTFDLSVFDLFVSWGRGASFHTFGPKELLSPGKRITSRELTIWFSVPSVGMVMRGLRQLKPDSLPSLRVSLFCGERLPEEVARSWAEAAPRSIVENLYGPTEVTIACTLYRWDGAKSPAACVGGVVPIGTPYPGMMAVVVDEALARVANGERGELCMRGPQVTAGYLKDEQKTRERYVAMPWDDEPGNRWYRTGDFAFVDERGDLVHMGRNDDQVKIRGYRVELPEIEHVLRASAGSDFVAVVPESPGPHGSLRLVAFVAGSVVDAEVLLAAAREKLPDYMVPAEVIALERLPLNSNGKIDKKALAALWESRHGDAR